MGDALEALKENANAIGWYDRTVRKAHAVLGLVHAEVMTEENARFAFEWALAITSNGLKLDATFQFAEKACARFKATGRMPTGVGWYHLSTVLDGFSRFVVAWKLCSTMRAEDVTETLNLALIASGLDQVKVRHRPGLLSDNSLSYIAGDLAEWLEDKGMTHVRCAPRHPQTQGSEQGPWPRWGRVSPERTSASARS